MRYLSLSLSLFILIFALSGCRTLMDPTFFPTSYAHHGKEYKAPPGPVSDDIGYDYTSDSNQQVIGTFITAATDLVNELENYTGLRPQSIYIQDKLQSSAFNNAYDYALREAFRAKGYTLANASDVFDARLSYEAISHSQKPVQVYGLQKKNDIIEDFDLVLNLYTGEIAPQTVRKAYTLPSYGYTASSELKPEDKNPQILESKEERTQNFTTVGVNN